MNRLEAGRRNEWLANEGQRPQKLGLVVGSTDPNGDASADVRVACRHGAVQNGVKPVALCFAPTNKGTGGSEKACANGSVAWWRCR